MSRFGNYRAIFNGADCRSYCWSQSHSDLEVRVKLIKSLDYDDLTVNIQSDSICIELEKSRVEQVQLDCCESQIDTLLEGKFEHPVDVDSAYWVLDREEPAVVIYIDKVEKLWWKSLLYGEQVIELGSQNYSVPLSDLTDEYRVVIDKLVHDQKDKLRDSHYDSDDTNPA